MSSVTLNERFLELYVGFVSAVSLEREPRNKYIQNIHDDDTTHSEENKNDIIWQFHIWFSTYVYSQ